MSAMRGFFLACSESAWLKDRATRLWFVRRTVSRFMPGETADAALAAAVEMREQSIGAVFTRLGENVKDREEAERVTQHYLELLDSIQSVGLAAELSIKLTQFGLDLDRAMCARNLERIIEHAGPKTMVWIDMEASQYVDVTLDLYRRARTAFPNVGVCLQAYLYRTARDLASMIPLGPAIRLVKGAYSEPPDRAFARKRAVDENYFALAKTLLSPGARAAGIRAAMATHDRGLIRRITEFAEANQIEKGCLEFQMLYGIQRREQVRLAHAGYNIRILISYGDYWFPWFMRRLGERPANALFVIRNLV
ncbi:MAG: proline dehydrogenase family protein [Terriglobia bacterium]